MQLTIWARIRAFIKNKYNTSTPKHHQKNTGTGKTFIGNTLLAYVRSKGSIALATATTGIAALLLEGGRTVHNRFKVPVPCTEVSTLTCSKSATRNKGLRDLLKKSELIIWDEAPMSHKDIFDCVDRSLRDLLDCDKPFGGKTVGAFFFCFFFFFFLFFRVFFFAHFRTQKQTNLNQNHQQFLWGIGDKSYQSFRDVGERICPNFVFMSNFLTKIPSNPCSK